MLSGLAHGQTQTVRYPAIVGSISNRLLMGVAKSRSETLSEGIVSIHTNVCSTSAIIFGSIEFGLLNSSYHTPQSLCCRLGVNFAAGNDYWITSQTMKISIPMCVGSMMSNRYHAQSPFVGHS
jgi:hypothetical protein